MSEFALWLNHTFYGFDAAVFAFTHSLAELAGGIFTPLLGFITFLGESGWFFIALGVAFLFFQKTRKIGIAMLIALLFGLVFTNLTLKNIIVRHRPFATDAQFYEYWQYVGGVHVGEFSFPSGHTTSAMAAGFAFFLFGNKKWSWSSLVLALLVGFSRIYFVVHYTTDVLAGLIVGSVAGALACLLVAWLYRLMEKQDNKTCKFLLQADILKLFQKK